MAATRSSPCPDPPPVRPWPWGALSVAVVSLAIQSIYLAESATADPTFRLPIIDAAVYHEAAARFAQGGPLADGAFWQPPLFPLGLSCLYRFIGVNVVAARIALALLAVLSCVLLWWIATALFSRRVGLIAGLSLAFYGPFVFFSTQLLPTGPGLFLDLLAIVVWLHCLRRSRWYLWLLLGLLTGAATLAVANAAVLGLVACAGLIVSAIRRRRWTPVLSCGLIVLGVGLAVFPVTYRNYVASGEKVIISTNGGINFYLGNNPESDRTVAIRPGEYWQRLLRESYGATVPTHQEQNAYFWSRGLAYVRTSPADFIWGLLRKTVRFVNAREIPRNVDVYVHRDCSALLSALIWRIPPFAFPFGLAAPLGLIGAVLWKRFPCASPAQQSGRLALIGFLVAYTASVVMFFIASRYRLPVVPVLLVFASALVVQIWDRVRQPTANSGQTARLAGLSLRGSSTPAGLPWRWRTGWIAAAFAALLTIVNIPWAAPTDRVDFRAERHMCLGHAHADRGEFDVAERHLRAALDLNPSFGAAAGKLANVVARAGRLDEAETLARRAHVLDEHSLDAVWILGDVFHRQGRLTEAADAFDEVLTVDPFCREAHIGLAEVHRQTGELDAAIDHYRRAVGIGTPSGRLLLRLAELLVQQGDYEEALRFFRLALRRIEPDAATLNTFAWLLATCPQTELRNCTEAIPLAKRLCEKTSYQDPIALDTLAAAYAQCDRLDEAVTIARLAFDLAAATGDVEMMDTIRARLHVYQAELGKRSKHSRHGGL